MHQGIYMFFVFFALAILIVQSFVAAMRLWVAGYVPKIFLVASAHAVSPSAIIQRVLLRRQVLAFERSPRLGRIHGKHLL